MTDGRQATPSQLTAVSFGVLGLGSVAAFLISSAQWNPGSNGWYAIVVGALLVSFHVRPQRTLTISSNVESINLDEVLIVPMLLMVEPRQGIAITCVASVAGAISSRRAWVQNVFNLGQQVFAVSVGYAVLAVFGVRTTSRPTFADALVGMLGALLVAATTALFVRAMVSFASGVSYRAMLAEMLRRVGPWTGAVTLGGVAAITVGAYPVAAILMLGVLFFVHRAYALTFKELTARRNAERLQSTIASLRNRRNPADVRVDLLSATRDLLGAGSAEVVSGDAVDATGSMSAPLRSSEMLRVTARRGLGAWTDEERVTLVTLAGVAGDVLRSTEAMAQLKTITDSQTEGVIALDLTGDITFANPAALQLLGTTDDTGVLGTPVQDALVLRNGRRRVDLEKMVAREYVARDADATLRTAHGETTDVAYSITPLRAEDAHVGAVLVLRDVTERRAFQDELARRALHDELTGLPNRRLLLDRLDQAIARSVGTDQQHGLLFLDLDRFKVVNDSYGHLIGDKLLIQIAGRLKSGLTIADSVARLSGDEFIVLVEDANDVGRLTSVAQNLLDLLEEPFDIDSHHIFMSASIGVGLIRAGQGRDEALAAVDAAAYAAKAAGRNCYFVSTDDEVERSRARLDLEVSLRQGLDQDELELYFQPIVTTERAEILGIEALVRWKSPEHGTLAPQEFVPLAEETGLIVPMDRWVLEESCRTVREWTLMHPNRRPLTVSVNLSALQLAQHRLPEHVSDTLARTGLPASQLCVEITETALMRDTEATTETLDLLHKLGVRVAIDDFGTGYSSLSYLKRFPIEVVKLDQSFISGLGSDPVDTEIARAVVRMSNALGIDTVAEGVETDMQRRILVQMGCQQMQGFLISRPLPRQQFLDFWTDDQDRMLGLLPGLHTGTPA